MDSDQSNGVKNITEEKSMTNRKKGWLVGGIMAAALISMTGCGDAIPELTEQQTEIFTEYAAIPGWWILP